MKWVFLLAIVLHAQFAWVPGFFKDGSLYAAFGKNAAEGGYWWLMHLNEINYREFSQHPPLYFILEGLFFKIFPPDFLWARLFSVSFSLALFGVIVIFLRKKEKSWVFWSFFLLALTPPLFKKARSPNLDIPLTLFMFSSLLCYLEAFLTKIKKRNFLYWMGSGFFFGLALLVKGPPALVIVGMIFFHLVYFKRLNTLLSPSPWLALLLGGLIFSIWPFMLWRIGEFAHFKAYFFDQVIGTVVDGRGRQDLALMTYPLYLLENNPLSFLSFIGSLILIGKSSQRRSDAHLVLLALNALFVIVPFSFVRWKYSNYIVPSLLPMAIMGGYLLNHFFQRFTFHVTVWIKRLVVVAMLVLCIFPLTNTIRRDPEIFKTIEMAKALQIHPYKWVVVEDAYPLYQLINLLGLVDFGDAIGVDKNSFVKELQTGEIGHDNLVLISVDMWKQMQKELGELNEKLDSFIYFKKRNIVVLLSKKEQNHTKQRLLVF